MQAYVQADYMQRNPSAKITDGVTGIQSFSITVTVVDKFFLNSGVYIEETPVGGKTKHDKVNALTFHVRPASGKRPVSVSLDLLPAT